MKIFKKGRNILSSRIGKHVTKYAIHVDRQGEKKVVRHITLRLTLYMTCYKICC